MKTMTGIYAMTMSLIIQLASAQDVDLHVNPQWKECSFQLDPSLTQKEWHQFTREAGMVACFRPVAGAKPMGKGRVEVSAVQWKTSIDETQGAWNNTFVHPDEEHYLIGGDALPFPGLTLRAGLTQKLDVGVYWTLRPGANYGFMGGQLQYNLLNAEKHKIDVSSRLGFNVLYGPDDVNFMVSALDVLAGKKFTFCKDWISVTPYVGGSTFLSRAHEKTDRVNLNDENVIGFQAMAGAVVGIRNLNFGVEYNLANVNTFSLRVGYNFGLWGKAK